LAVKGIPQVINNIKAAFDRKKVATYALCLEYAAQALDWFWSIQPPKPGSWGAFWNNVTGQASMRMHSDAQITTNYISWMMAHGVQYGVYLELANDGKHESIRPIIKHFLPQFKKDLAQIWGHEVA
jgi:hypothetical protein